MPWENTVSYLGPAAPLGYPRLFDNKPLSNLSQLHPAVAVREMQFYLPSLLRRHGAYLSTVPEFLSFLS